MGYLVWRSMAGIYRCREGLFFDIGCLNLAGMTLLTVCIVYIYMCTFTSCVRPVNGNPVLVLHSRIYILGICDYV